jgi:hypothetical protein
MLKSQLAAVPQSAGSQSAPGHAQCKKRKLEHVLEAKKSEHTEQCGSPQKREPSNGRSRANVPFAATEVDALKKGVQKHGAGYWTAILEDPTLHFNRCRSAISLKDKWRNLQRARAAVDYRIRHSSTGV